MAVHGCRPRCTIRTSGRSLSEARPPWWRQTVIAGTESGVVVGSESSRLIPRRKGVSMSHERGRSVSHGSYRADWGSGRGLSVGTKSRGGGRRRRLGEPGINAAQREAGLTGRSMAMSTTDGTTNGRQHRFHLWQLEWRRERPKARNTRWHQLVCCYRAGLSQPAHCRVAQRNTRNRAQIGKFNSARVMTLPREPVT